MMEAEVISKDLFDTLACPVCVKENAGSLEAYGDYWLICQDCGRKYPIWDGILIMRIDEGDKWRATEKEDLPVPPPMPG